MHKNERQRTYEQESHAVARKPRDAAAVLFGLKFADNIHYKYKISQLSKARIHSSKHTGAKQNLMQNDHSRSFKVTCFGVSDNGLSNTKQQCWPYLLRFRRCSIYERSAVFPRISNILRITVRFRTSPLVVCKKQTLQ